MKHLTLSGYYGYGNAGDEAVLAGLVAGFRAVRPESEMEITALSGHPAKTQAAHGIGAVDRYKPAALLREIGCTDLFLSGGGSLLQDVTSAHGIFYYLGVVRMAQMRGKKTMFIAQGIGPLKRARSRQLVKSVADRLDAITVRDADSAALLREIGVGKPPLEVTADPALLLIPDPVMPQSGAFGVALRPWQGQENLAAQVAEACEAVLRGRRALQFPMQPASDLPIAEQFAQKWHPGERSESHAGFSATDIGLVPLLSNIASCDLMIGMRLHALILAAAAGVPSVALSYDPKVDAFMTSSGQGDAVYNLTRSDPNVLAALLARVWEKRAKRAEALQAALPGLRARAARNVDVALGVL